MNHTPNSDIIKGIYAFRIWGTLGWHDIKQRYRRSVLGPFWFTLSTAIMVGVLGALYSSILNQEIANYLPFLAAGLVVWQFISSSILEGCTVFIASSALIKQIDLPLSVHVCRVVWRNFIILLHSLPIVVLALIIFGDMPSYEILLLPFGLILLLFNALWITVVLGILCTRYRDVLPIVSNFLQIAFFFTPIMWSPEILKDRGWIAEYNPLYHLIEIVRAPILGKQIPMESWYWSIGLVLAGLALGQYLMSQYRNRVAYWL
ncbi:ABC transporter permease [Polynucleobacter sp. UK-Mo-2m-Kol15]|uniref:ABC transporter permease n=1 Tax=Polynucleobacter sp. UK-Mo-2m-Kol15 TaxID=2576916 RepID=UPI001C0D8C9F|nr:ABC transporter permease [Polynucleobacter sp. UK-Mo-2m-Kol15]MBU3574765.1 ABC transporter permease [Polynucleobacter sp. UK-Mo-2m-Kol15]